MVDWAMAISTVTLIGMPGAGKSTIGVLLAKRLGLNFADGDLLIQVREGEPLQATVDRLGYLEVRRIEEEVLLTVPLEKTLLATGGSAVYSEAVMARCKAAGPVIYLEAPLEVLVQRVALHPDRGIACPPGQDLADVYAERVPLYERFADITVSATVQSAEATAQLLADRLAGRAS